jgi:dipeptidyl aminopeptidase/acylaminoacyl peptidase
MVAVPAFLALAAGLHLSAAAQLPQGSGLTKRPMTYEDVVTLEAPSDPRISPDGSLVVFGVRERDGAEDAFNEDLYLVSTSEGRVRRLTYHPKRDAFARWRPDGQSVAFLSGRGERTQIYLLPADGGEARPLTEHDTDIASFQWSPDGESIYFVAPVPREAEEGEPKVDEVIVVDREYPYAHIWRVDLATEAVEQVSAGEYHVVDAELSPDGARFALIVRPSPKIADVMAQEVYLLPAVGGELERLTDNDYAEGTPRWSPDGSRVAYLSEADGNPVAGPSRIHMRSVSGEGEPRVLARGFDGYIRDYRWSPDGQSFVFYADHRVNRHIYRVRAGDGEQPTRLTEGDGLHGSFTLDWSGRAMAYLHENPENPPDVWWKPAPDEPSQRLTQLNPQSAPWALGKVETIRWRSTDGMEIEGLLVYPVNYEPGRTYPTILEVHGGPEGAYTRGFIARYGSFPHIYAAAGYLTLMPNFRGSSNYGAAFAQANKGDVGGGDFRDCMTGLDYLIERGLADPNRLVIKGWSYGGYMSGWAIGHTDRFAVTAYGAGLSNAVSYYGTADIQFSRENLHGGTPYTNRERWMEMSPLSYVQNVSTPALIFHGENDARVPLSQSKEFYLGLRKRGVPAQLVIYPNQPHGLRVPSYQLDKMRREFDWIEKYIKAKDVT